MAEGGKAPKKRKEAYKVYRSSGQQEKNKAMKLARYLRDHPANAEVKAALLKLPEGAINEAVKTYGLNLNPNKK